MTPADWQAVAVAHLERGEPTPARRAARRALAATDPRESRAAELHLLLAWIEQDSGNSRACLRHVDLAQPHLRGALLARARCLRGLNRCVAGDYPQAHRELSAAVAGSRRHDDRHWLANALNARGVARTYLRRFAAAERDLSTAQGLYLELGERERAATCLHNRGFVALQAGEPLRALELFDAAMAAGVRVSMRPEALIDRAYALLGAGLITPAGDALNRAASLLGDAGRNMRLAEATLAFGQCAARAGRREVAVYAARRGREMFRVQRRAGWLVAADALELRLTVADGTVTLARHTARKCLRHGLRADAAELRLAAADVAGGATARQLLRLVAEDRRHGQRRVRELGWLARARLAERDGDRRGVLSACRAGLRVANGSEELLGIGLSAVLEAGESSGVLRWVGQVPVGELVESLGGSALLHYFWHGDRLLVASLVDGQVRVVGLPCSRPRLSADVDALRFALASQARAGGDRMRSVAVDAARRLERALLAPMSAVAGDRSVVVVPATGMRGLPWAALRSGDPPISIAPSASAWLRAARISVSDVDDRAWVAGPGLRHAGREVTGLHTRWGGTLLIGSESTVDNVLTALDGAGLVHVAAHGRSHPDAPLCAGLELFDGPLFGHHLGRVARPPRVVVLSACESVDLATTLVGRGTRAVVASTLPVVDEAAVELVGVLHAHLGAGLGVAEALGRAQGECGDVGFVCVGAG